MARLSVYVADELLERARAVRARGGLGAQDAADAENTSQLVQRGLQRLIDEQDRPPVYADTPKGSNEKIARLRDRLVTEARQDYGSGYSVALEAADYMPLSVIDSLASAKFDLKKWLKIYRDAFDNPESEQEGHDAQEILDSIDRCGDLSEVLEDQNCWWWMYVAAKALGTLADPYPFDMTVNDVQQNPYAFTATTACKRGFIDAMRNLWNELEAATSTSESGNE